MQSSFFGLNVATQGLFSARAGLDVSNHNITNAETKGYSRQYAVQVASRPLPNGPRGMVGTGSEVTTIDRYRNEYLDNKYWTMSNDFGEYSVKSEIMSQVELIFKEPTDAGFNEYFNEIFESLHDLSINSSDNASRNNFINSAISYVEYMNDTAEKLRQNQRDANFAVKTKVDEINYISTQLASLNNQITNLELTGSKANDLRDERVKLIDQLSQIVNVEAKEVEDVNGKATLRVSINGQALVQGPVANFLKVVPRETLHNPEDEIDLYDIYWTSGARFYTDNPNLSGELKGLVDVRDGNNGENFTGTISAGQGTKTIVVDNPSRHDIPASGELFIEGVYTKYTSFTYDEVADQITFTIDPDPAEPACPAGATGIRIGEDMSYKGVPYYMQQINEFVRTIALKFNEIHKQGLGGTGSELFVYEGYTGIPPLDETNKFTYNAMTIDNIKVAQDIIDDPELLKTYYNVDDGESANDLILDLINLRHDTNLFSKGEPDNYMQAILGELGIDVKQGNSFKSGQEHLVKMIDNQRMSFSGVDLNEETANMIKFQQAYNVSAKIISIMDEIYDVTINGMGAR